MMNKEEIEYLREYLKEIIEYKGLQEELTYDIPLEMLKRFCIVFDCLQQRIDKAIEYINKLKEYPYLERYYVGELLEILGGKE